MSAISEFRRFYLLGEDRRVIAEGVQFSTGFAVMHQKSRALTQTFKPEEFESWLKTITQLFIIEWADSKAVLGD